MNDYFDFTWVGKLSTKKNKMEKIKSFLKSFVNFILWSSANSQNYSLTLKMGVPFLVLWGIGDSATWEELVGAIGLFFTVLAQGVTLAGTIYGLIRKVWLSMK